MFKTTTNKQGYVIVTKLQKIPTKKHPPTKTTFNTNQLNYQKQKKNNNHYILYTTRYTPSLIVKRSL